MKNKSNIGSIPKGRLRYNSLLKIKFNPALDDEELSES